MVSTPELIRRLVADASPVRPLRPPLLRAGIWLAFAAAVLTAVALSFGLRADLEGKLHEIAFVTEVGAAALTGVAAAIAAFQLSLPDRSSRWAVLPLPTLMVWLSSIGYGCLTNWVTLGPDGPLPGLSLRCFATILLGSTPLAVVLLFMLRHAHSVRPTATVVIGAIAVAALTVSALRLFHDLDATVMVLIWNVGAGAVISGGIALFGPRLLQARAFSSHTPNGP